VKEANSPGWGPPPRILVAVSLLVLSVCTVLAVLGAFRTGITTDEPIHVMRLRNYFDTGWYALDWDYGGAGPGADGTNTFVYGPVTMLLLHAWSVLCGVEGWNEVATSPHAYDVRHLGVVFIGLVSVGAVAVIGRLILEHWRWGLVAAAALASIPMWTGHAMFNVKDVPVATGYTLVTLGLMCFLRDEPSGIRLRLARSGCLVAGLVLTLGTRPGMWPGIFAVLWIAVLGILVASRRRGVARSMAATGLIEIAAACVAAGVALVAIYPRLFGSPIRALPRTTESSSSFLGGVKSNRLYVPRHVAEEMPTLLLVFVLTGAAIGALLIWQRWRTHPVLASRLALVGLQAFALPVVAIVMGADLYHGLRQLLFAAPPAAVLAAFGMAWLLQGPAREGSGVRRSVVALGAAAALVLPVMDQVTLQPYQTTYVNLATDLVSGNFADAANRPGGDYWRASIPELIADQPLDHQLLCKALVDKESDIAFPFTNGGEAFSTSRNLDCREEANGPLDPEHLPVERRPSDNEFDAVFLKTLPKNCVPLNEVTRTRHGFDIVLTILGRCTSDLPVLTTRGVRVDDPALGTGAPEDVWRFAIDGWEQWPGRDGLSSPLRQARIAFEPGDACRHIGCTLVIKGDGPSDLVATMAGHPMPVIRRAGHTLRIKVPPRQALAGDGVWLTLSRRSGETLGMRLTALSLTPSKEGPQ
jgi:hypothetical protein